MRRAAERVADADGALRVHRRATHPAVEPLRRVRALLVQRHVALLVDPALVPPHATTAGRGIDGVDGDDRLAIADPAIHQPRHDLVALCVETAVHARLGHAIRELTVAEVVIWRD